MHNWKKQLRCWIIASTCVATFFLNGCGKEAAPAQTKLNRTSAGGDPVSNGSNGNNWNQVASSTSVNFNQPFEDAVITDVIDGQHFPPDVTIGGKKTASIRSAAEDLWPKIKLTDATGAPIPFTMTVNTTAGPIEIKLQPDIAPNHVRNFLALARLGYYDGLCFERVIHQEAETEGIKSGIDLVVAGCPAGTGDDGLGHIGYFVRAEFQENLKHAEGTVGFWHEEDKDSAGTRFYITLGPAPAFDGRFTVVGTVSKGLDVVKKIASAPLQSKDTYPENEKPVAPVIIQKATPTPETVEK